MSSAYLNYWYFSQQSWFWLVLHPAWHFTWHTLHRSSMSRMTIYKLVPNVEQVHCYMSISNCCFLTCIKFSQKTGKVVWYSYLFKKFSTVCLSNTIKGFSIVNEAGIVVFLEFSSFSMIQQMLLICTLVPLPFLNPASISGCSHLMYCWSLTWRILSITFYCVRWVCSSLNILCIAFLWGLEWKLTFSSPADTAEVPNSEFSK